VDPLDSLLTTRQLQALLQVDRITIYRMLNDGRLQGFKVGGQWRFTRQAIEQWLQEQQASLGVAAAPESTVDLQPSAEALPLTCVRAIQGVFADALGVGTMTTAVSGSPLTPVANSCAFCNLILGSQAGRQRCIASWQAGAVERGSAPPRLATCHAGLRYVWGRIEVRGQFVAATHAGQFRDTSSESHEWSRSVQKLAMAIGVDPERLLQASSSVPVLDEARQQQLARLLQRVATTFSEIGEERLELLDRLRRIAEISST
jgi:excisionase family DNA binding protein